MVRYGTSVAYDFEVSSPALVTSHALALTWLSPDTIYHYQIVSADAAHNVSASMTFSSACLLLTWFGPAKTGLRLLLRKWVWMGISSRKRETMPSPPGTEAREAARA